MASSTVPRGLHVLAVRLFTTCSLPIKLRLLISFAFIIRKRRLALGVCFGFTRGEYHIALVDFIVALRRTKGRRRRTLRSPSPPSSGLHLLTPGNPLRRGITAAAGLGQYRIPVSGAVVHPQFRIWFGCLCSVLYRSRFRRVVGLWSHVFHYWGIGRLCLRLRGGLLFLS